MEFLGHDKEDTRLLEVDRVREGVQHRRQEVVIVYQEPGGALASATLPWQPAEPTAYDDGSWYTESSAPTSTKSSPSESLHAPQRTSSDTLSAASLSSSENSSTSTSLVASNISAQPTTTAVVASQAEILSSGLTSSVASLPAASAPATNSATSSGGITLTPGRVAAIAVAGGCGLLIIVAISLWAICSCKRRRRKGRPPSVESAFTFKRSLDSTSGHIQPFLPGRGSCSDNGDQNSQAHADADRAPCGNRGTSNALALTWSFEGKDGENSHAPQHPDWNVSRPPRSLPPAVGQLHPPPVTWSGRHQIAQHQPRSTLRRPPPTLMPSNLHRNMPPGAAFNSVAGPSPVSAVTASSRPMPSRTSVFQAADRGQLVGNVSIRRGEHTGLLQAQTILPPRNSSLPGLRAQYPTTMYTPPLTITKRGHTKSGQGNNVSTSSTVDSKPSRKTNSTDSTAVEWLRSSCSDTSRGEVRSATKSGETTSLSVAAARFVPGFLFGWTRREPDEKVQQQEPDARLSGNTGEKQDGNMTNVPLSAVGQPQRDGEAQDKSSNALTWALSSPWRQSTLSQRSSASSFTCQGLGEAVEKTEAAPSHVQYANSQNSTSDKNVCHTADAQHVRLGDWLDLDPKAKKEGGSGRQGKRRDEGHEGGESDCASVYSKASMDADKRERMRETFYDPFRASGVDRVLLKGPSRVD